MQLTRGLSRVGAQPRLAQSRKQGAPRPKMGFHGKLMNTILSKTTCQCSSHSYPPCSGHAGTQALAQSHQSAPANGSVAVQTLGLPPVSFLGLKGVLFGKRSNGLGLCPPWYYPSSWEKSGSHVTRKAAQSHSSLPIGFRY